MTQTLNVIGDLSTARTAAALYMEWRATMDDPAVPYYWRPTAPGWKWLGGGCSRQAWLGPDNVVYKIGMNSQVRNEALAYAIKGMLDDPEFAIPKASIFVIPGDEGALMVGAMEFLGENGSDILDGGECECKYECDTHTWEDCDCDCWCGRGEFAGLWERAYNFFGTTDFHEGNVREVNGKIYCIDLGYCDFVSGGW